MIGVRTARPGVGQRGVCPSGQRGRAVNPLAYAFEGSNPSAPNQFQAPCPFATASTHGLGRCLLSSSPNRRHRLLGCVSHGRVVRADPGLVAWPSAAPPRVRQAPWWRIVPRRLSSMGRSKPPIQSGWSQHRVVSGRSERADAGGGGTTVSPRGRGRFSQCLPLMRVHSLYTYRRATGRDPPACIVCCKTADMAHLVRA